jgi:two-component system, NarL family, response regulator NreC
MAIKILIADDHQLFRESLTSLFDAELFEIVGHASSGQEAIEKARELQPDVVLMDISMNGMNGIEATQILKAEMPKVRVLGLSMHAQKSYVRGILEAGAYGYLLKNCNYHQLSEAIISVSKGNKFLSDEITDIVISDYLDKQHDENDHPPEITTREEEILKLYAEGKSTRQIANQLFISVKTVGSHKQNIFKKLAINSPAQMVKYALKKGLIKI